MTRKSFFYKMRRKGQVLAHHLLGPEFMSKLYYKILIHNNLDLKNPQTFNEKLQWLKLFYWPNHPKAIQCADKFAVRSYLKKLGREDILNEILFVWENVNEICWDELPNQFVLKCNHGCGYNILCPDKNMIDKKKAEKQLRPPENSVILFR